MKRTPDELGRQAMELLRAALQLKPEDRTKFIDQACAADPELRAEIESLLAHQEPGFLETPAFADTHGTFAEIILLGSNQPIVKNQAPVLTPGVVVGGRYLIEKKLGQGGIGVVFLAQDQQLNNKPVVIKVLLETFKDHQLKTWIEKKFKQEITALSRIDHPGVVRALDVGQLSDGRSYLVMQYVEGVDLRSVMQPQGMNLERVGPLVRQIGEALTAAHEQGIFHRDLKPENIMLQTTDDEERVKLIDFGIATVLDTPNPTTIKTTEVVGTVEYMAPEQLRGKPAAASDIFALGVIAYEMVTGRRPFNPDTPYSLWDLQRAGVKVNPCDLRPSLPEAAQAAILKALAFNPRHRYPRASDFGEALARALADEAMPPALEESPPLELGHVLFTDLVGYSKLMLDEQTRLLQIFQEVVSGTAEFQRALVSNQLIRLPTGDGMALVFFGDPIAPVKCALEIARALKRQPEIKLRMGIHTGPVRRIADINQNINVAGGGINIAQRVMDLGDAGHILLTKTVAEILSQLSDWKNHLHDCGEHEVKHGVKLHVFNLYTGELGNPEPPEKIRAIAPSPKAAARRIGCQIQITIALLAILGSVGLWGYYKMSYHATGAPSQHIPVSPPNPELSYSLLAQKDPKRYPGGKPFLVPGEIIFEAGYQVRLNVTSPQGGYLYVINEGPAHTHGLPDYVVLFPDSLTHGGSAKIGANQIVQIPPPSGKPEQDWFVFDKEEGVERIWLVWSEQSVPELEAVKGRANPKARGVISDPSQIKSVAQYLTMHSATKPEVEKDEATKQTILKGQGEVLVGLVKLEHH